VILKENGGKGFHYFLRDLCTILVSWNYVPDHPSDSTKLLMTKVINALILISADEVKLIFKQNIKIISSLMTIWKSFILVNKSIITKMLSIPDSEPKSQLWKMNAIEVLALAVCNQIPIVPKTDDVLKSNE
jgi:DNA-dependent protein kinase catalytic subunit